MEYVKQFVKMDSTGIIHHAKNVICAVELVKVKGWINAKIVLKVFLIKLETQSIHVGILIIHFLANHAQLLLIKSVEVLIIFIKNALIMVGY